MPIAIAEEEEMSVVVESGIGIEAIVESGADTALDRIAAGEEGGGGEVGSERVVGLGGKEGQVDHHHTALQLRGERNDQPRRMTSWRS